MIGFVMNQRMIEEYNYRQRMSDEEKKREKEWSLEECKKRGCLPTGEPLEALFGTGY